MDFKFNEFFSVLNLLRLINNNRDDAEGFLTLPSLILNIFSPPFVGNAKLIKCAK